MIGENMGTSSDNTGCILCILVFLFIFVIGVGFGGFLAECQSQRILKTVGIERIAFCCNTQSNWHEIVWIEKK